MSNDATIVIDVLVLEEDPRRIEHFRRYLTGVVLAIVPNTQELITLLQRGAPPFLFLGCGVPEGRLIAAWIGEHSEPFRTMQTLIVLHAPREKRITPVKCLFARLGMRALRLPAACSDGRLLGAIVTEIRKRGR